MEPDDPTGDDEPHPRLLPPDDRLWRHPSEVARHGLPPDDDEPARRPAPTWLVAVLAGAIGAVLAVGSLAATGNLRRILKVPVVERVALPVGSLTGGAGPEPRVAEISRRLRPAVVALRVEATGRGPAQGAGVVFRSDGHVLTSHDVVVGATRIEVVLADGRRTEGRVVGTDPWAGVAVIKVDDGITVPVATMGSSAGLAVGQEVMAVGAPAGPDDEVPVVVGAVGALGRQVVREGEPTLLDMIETDGAVAAAFSGGPLVDGSGAVVGVTTAAGQGGEGGAGYAVPIDWARVVADQLAATGKVVRVWMGVEGSDLDAEAARTMGLDGGAVVTTVRDGSPAGSAGLAPTDVITAVDGTPVLSMAALRILVRPHRPGDEVTLAVRRGTAVRTVRVRLAERPA